ncbi:MAG: hypothetical protein U1E73_12520 [Planctomycetota bacterium]
MTSDLHCGLAPAVDREHGAARVPTDLARHQDREQRRCHVACGAPQR